MATSLLGLEFGGCGVFVSFVWEFVGYVRCWEEREVQGFLPLLPEYCNNHIEVIIIIIFGSEYTTWRRFSMIPFSFPPHFSFPIPVFILMTNFESSFWV